MTTKQITDTREADKVKEARAALRGATKHTETLIQHNAKMAAIMDQQAEMLRHIADKAGDIHIPIFDSAAGRTAPQNLKNKLREISARLADGAAA